MRLTEKVKLDFKGRITIPLYIREVLGLFEGSSVIIEADTSSRILKIVPLEYKGSVHNLEFWIEDINTLSKIIDDLLNMDGVNEIIDLKCVKYIKGYKCTSAITIDPENISSTINQISSKYFIKT